MLNELQLFSASYLFLHIRFFVFLAVDPFTIIMKICSCIGICIVKRLNLFRRAPESQLNFITVTSFLPFSFISFTISIVCPCSCLDIPFSRFPSYWSKISNIAIYPQDLVLCVYWCSMFRYLPFALAENSKIQKNWNFMKFGISGGCSKRLG